MLTRTTFRFVLLFLLAAVASNGQLAVHVDVNQVGDSWTYTLTDDEPLGSPNYLTSFGLEVSAPVTVIGVPSGWDFITDNASYVYWFDTDASVPYPDDVAPGDTLSGFALQSTGATSSLFSDNIAAWDHSADAPGPSYLGETFAPTIAAVATAVPEPNVWIISIVGIVTAILYFVRQFGIASMRLF